MLVINMLHELLERKELKEQRRLKSKVCYETYLQLIRNCFEGRNGKKMETIFCKLEKLKIKVRGKGL